MSKLVTLLLPLSLMLGGVALQGANAAQIYPPAWYSQTSMMPDQYQGPHGHYGSQTGFIRSLEGIPCGEACTARAAERWGHAAR